MFTYYKFSCLDTQGYTRELCADTVEEAKEEAYRRCDAKELWIYQYTQNGDLINIVKRGL